EVHQYLRLHHRPRGSVSRGMADARSMAELEQPTRGHPDRATGGELVDPYGDAAATHLGQIRYRTVDHRGRVLATAPAGDGLPRTHGARTRRALDPGSGRLVGDLRRTGRAGHFDNHRT